MESKSRCEQTTEMTATIMTGYACFNCTDLLQHTPAIVAGHSLVKAEIIMLVTLSSFERFNARALRAPCDPRSKMIEMQTPIAQVVT